MSITVEARPVEFLSVSIAASATVSSAFEVPGKVVGLFAPATNKVDTFYFRAATALAGTYAALKTAGNSALTITVATATAAAVSLEPAKFLAARYCILHRSAAQTPTVSYTVAYIR